MSASLAAGLIISLTYLGAAGYIVQTLRPSVGLISLIPLLFGLVLLLLGSVLRLCFLPFGSRQKGMSAPFPILSAALILFAILHFVFAIVAVPFSLDRSIEDRSSIMFLMLSPVHLFFENTSDGPAFVPCAIALQVVFLCLGPYWYCAFVQERVDRKVIMTLLLLMFLNLASQFPMIQAIRVTYLYWNPDPYSPWSSPKALPYGYIFCTLTVLESLSAILLLLLRFLSSRQGKYGNEMQD